MKEIVFLALTALEKALIVVQKVRAAAQQSGEWTPEEEAQFQARLETVTSQEHWKIDPS